MSRPQAPGDSEEIRRIRDVYDYLENSEDEQAKWHLSNPGRVLMQKERRSVVEGILRQAGRLPGPETQILDVGCGRGAELSAMKDLGARETNLWGIDLLTHRVEKAGVLLPAAHLQTGSAEHIDAPTGAFDLVMLFTVMSSIRDEPMRRRIVGEITRVLKPRTADSTGGAVLWYDMRLPNPWNRHNLPLSRQDVARLFRGFDLELQSTTLLPPLARRLGRASDLMYPLLASMPALRSHLCGLLFPPSVSR